MASPAANPYFADLPPITPASFGRGPSVKRRSSSRWLTIKNVKTYAPVGLVLGLITYPYIPFNLLLVYWTTFSHGRSRWLVLYQTTTYHVLLGLSLWSFYVAWKTPPGSPADGEEEGDEEEGFALVRREEALGAEGARGGGGVMVKASTGERRFCKKCNVPKPDRCHHCSTCGRCILKMDHHCLWLGTCIGQKNYRAFLLFLTYVSLYSIFVALEAIRTVWGYFDEEEYITEFDFTPVSHFLLILDGCAFGLSIGGFAIYHWYLAMTNKTTLESLERSRSAPAILVPSTASHSTALRWRPDHLLTREERRRALWEEEINPFDLGWKANLASLSPARGWWVLPSAVKEDGMTQRVDEEKVEQLRVRTRRLRLGELVDDDKEEDKWGVVDVESESDGGGDDGGDEEDRLGGGGRRRGVGGTGQGVGWDTRTWRG